MDYILEELERQRLAMELLLAAPSKEPAENAEQEPREERLEGFGPEVRDARAANAAVKMRAVDAGEGDRIPRSELRMEKEWRELSAAGKGERKARGGEAALRLSAQEVSRAVERDARRYDGGYQGY